MYDRSKLLVFGSAAWGENKGMANQMTAREQRLAALLLETTKVDAYRQATQIVSDDLR
jgi:hypothetical protein